MEKGFKKDKYISTLSGVISVPDAPLSLTVDLTLSEQPEISVTQSISGTVTDALENRLADSIIQIYDKDKIPLDAYQTDDDGKYAINTLKVNETYYISAIAENRKISDLVEINLKEGVDKIIDFTLDESINVNTISGVIYSKQGDATTKSGAVITLLRYEGDKLRVYAITFSNQNGTYMLTDVKPGKYVIRVTALGYSAIEQETQIDSDGEIKALDFTLSRQPINSKAFIHGVIYDENKKPLKNADVILYKAVSDVILEPISLEKTNELGEYIFVDVSPGNYRVLSNNNSNAQ